MAETALGACGDVLNGATWYGESAAELIQMIRDAHQLAERIALHDQRGRWRVWSEPGPPHDQYSDSYLQRDAVGISMEHKGGRLETDFLVGGDGRRVVGPDAEILDKLEAVNR